MRDKISVIIAAKTDSEDLPILESLRKVGYPEDRTEIILTTGNHPSVQRNKAAWAAKGDILYFFNRDSRLGPGMFNKAVEIFDKDKKIAGVGGPDITPPDNGYLQRLFGYAMGSYFAHWKMRARYSQIGKERLGGEKELILSNLAVKRDVFLETGGFNEGLYPNEENELINRISKMGYKFIYSPDMKIYRDRRKTVPEFAAQFYKYGRGRMDQIFMEGFFKNARFAMPFLLTAYFLILPFLWKYPVSFAPLFLYIILAEIDAAYLSFKHKRNLIFSLPAVYLIMHVSYALGMAGGLGAVSAKKRLAKKNYSEPRIKIIKSLGTDKRDY